MYNSRYLACLPLFNPYIHTICSLWAIKPTKVHPCTIHSIPQHSFSPKKIVAHCTQNQSKNKGLQGLKMTAGPRGLRVQRARPPKRRKGPKGQRAQEAGGAELITRRIKKYIPNVPRSPALLSLAPRVYSLKAQSLWALVEALLGDKLQVHTGSSVYTNSLSVHPHSTHVHTNRNCSRRQL